jgi:phage tail sheath protein FI
MAFQVSPGVNVSEIDLTTVVPSVATTTGAIAGVFQWGPVGKFLLVDSENNLVSKYGKPNSDNAETFFTAANFLAYGNRLYVSRAAATTGFANAQSAGLNGNTILTANGTLLAVSVGDGVYGSGIAEGTFVTAANNSTITISKDATLGNSTVASTQTVQFFANTLSFNAAANSSTAAARSSWIVKNSDHWETVTVPSGVEYVARYPGAIGNSLKVSVCDSAAQWSETVNPYAITANSTLIANSSTVPGNSGIVMNVNESSANIFVFAAASGNLVGITNTAAIAEAVKSKLIVGDYVELGNTSIGKQKLKIKTIGSVTQTDSSGGATPNVAHFSVTFDSPLKLSTNYSSNTFARYWEYHNVVDTAPATSPSLVDAGSSVVDQVSVVVADENGEISGVAGTVLEVFQNLSRATNAKNADGSAAYYKTVINDFSKYVWAANDRSGAVSNTVVNVTNSTATTPYTASFVGGRDGASESAVSVGALASAYDLFADSSAVDISLVMTGPARGSSSGAQLANYLIDNIAEVRKDCVVFLSPEKTDVFGAGVDGAQVSNVTAFRDNVRSSSYAIMDSGYKYQYDKYNDVYRWIPLNGDTAGLTARNDDLRDPWFSPAGFNRGQIKNVVKLAWNPNKAERDELYKKGVNPVVTFPGQGTILYGDKTLIGKTSAFDRINVRRLFIVLEKAIATAANSMLFEFNDEFTRAQFKNLIEPFLRDIQGRRGIYDFRVVCDETNNSAEVIDGNRFVGDIYIKPAKSINNIQLNFVAARTGVEFNEIVGQF